MKCAACGYEEEGTFAKTLSDADGNRLLVSDGTLEDRVFLYVCPECSTVRAEGPCTK